MINSKSYHYAAHPVYYVFLTIFLAEFHIHNKTRQKAAKFRRSLFFSVFKEGQIILRFNEANAIYQLEITTNEIRMSMYNGGANVFLQASTYICTFDVLVDKVRKKTSHYNDGLALNWLLNLARTQGELN